MKGTAETQESSTIHQARKMRILSSKDRLPRIPYL